MNKTLGMGLVALLLAGCQSSPRQFDGVLGYQVDSRHDGGLVLSYTDEDNWSWEELEKRAITACARELNEGPAALRLAVATREQFSRPVNLVILVPMAGGGMVEPRNAHPLGPGLSAGAGESYHRVETILRDLKLKKISGDCSIAGL